jgi:putative membrane protein
MTLIIFAIGAVLGVVGLSNLLDKIYSRHRDILNWLFAGLIIGTGRMMIPANLDNPVLFILVALLGFMLVWKWEIS